MSEYIGKINVPKDTMLHVVNNIFNQNVKSKTTKDEILEVIKKIYIEENFDKIIKMLPYEAYLLLEKLLEFTKNNQDINEFERQIEHKGIYYLEEAMIVIMRAKHLEYNYSLNPGVIENLHQLFNEKNKKMAERYARIENLAKGIIYSYGVVEFNFMRKTICKHMNEIITQKELEDIIFTRLNLNTLINYHEIRWTNTNEREEFVTYLIEEYDDIDIGDIAAGQKSRGLKYKPFTEKELLDRDEYLWNKQTQKFFNFIKSKSKNIFEFEFKRIIKDNELGKDILNKLIHKCEFKNESEVIGFMKIFMEWYNNAPQYILGGYSPVEFRKMC